MVSMVSLCPLSWRKALATASCSALRGQELGGGGALTRALPTTLTQAKFTAINQSTNILLYFTQGEMPTALYQGPPGCAPQQLSPLWLTAEEPSELRAVNTPCRNKPTARRLAAAD